MMRVSMIKKDKRRKRLDRRKNGDKFRVRLVINQKFFNLQKYNNSILIGEFLLVYGREVFIKNLVYGVNEKNLNIFLFEV